MRCLSSEHDTIASATALTASQTSESGKSTPSGSFIRSHSATSLERGIHETTGSFTASAKADTILTSASPPLRLATMPTILLSVPDRANMPRSILLQANNDMNSPDVTNTIPSERSGRIGMAKPPHTTSPRTSYTKKSGFDSIILASRMIPKAVMIPFPAQPMPGSGPPDSIHNTPPLPTTDILSGSPTPLRTRSKTVS